MEEWQYKQIDSLLKIINKEWTYIDIGCARGEMLNFFIEQMNKGYAFEPAPDNFSFLSENFGKIKNLEIIQKAVSNKNGAADFWLHPTSTHESNLLGHDTGYKKYSDESKISIECTTLDEFLKDKPDVHFIKIDVEGSEWDIFEGAKDTLRNKNIVYQVEFHLDEDWHKKKIIYDSGYDIYDLNFNRLSIFDSRIYQAILISDRDDRFDELLKK